MLLVSIQMAQFTFLYNLYVLCLKTKINGDFHVCMVKSNVNIALSTVELMLQLEMLIITINLGSFLVSFFHTYSSNDLSNFARTFF